MPGLGDWGHHPLPDRFSGIAGILYTQWPMMRASIILGEFPGWELGIEELGVVGTEKISAALRSIQGRSMVSWAES